jgi:peptidoglycan/xylan/chitin deacetylase (PgdA/CDA1 family)
VPNGAIVVTFDDGYVDNLLCAKSLLEKYETPATVFVTTGYVNQRREFWWDVLERLLLLSPSLPDRLRTTVKGQVHEWVMGRWAQLSPEDARTYEEWNVGLRETPTARHQAYRDLHRLLCPLRHDEREAILEDLSGQVKANEGCLPESRALSRDELCELSHDELVEIGSHTVTHSLLAEQTFETQRYEVTESKQQLETILGRPVTSFSYPYGGRGDIGEKAMNLVRDAGYEIACTSFALPVTRRSDPFFLPRLIVRDWNGEEFAGVLHRFFNA